MSQSPPRVVAVVVAYNRAELLTEALEALAVQTRPLDGVVVVDNASTDDSAAIARSSRVRPELVQLTRNTGGAGGFAVGIERAIVGQSADLVWVMDDDTIPTPTALEQLLAVRAAAPVTPLVVASKVVWTDGSEHPMNTPRAKPFVRADELADAERAGGIPVRSASFVSSMFDARAIAESGLPIVDYFIWNDDFEFSARLLRRGRGLHTPRSVVLHKTKVLGSTDADPGERFYYEVRNKLWLFRCSGALSRREKLLYIGASLRRWARTFLRSSDRAVLRAAFRRGIRDGFRTRPLSNGAALADLGTAGELVASFEARAEAAARRSRR